MKKNELYIAPEVEVLNVMVEKGFKNSQSGIEPMPDDGDLN